MVIFHNKQTAFIYSAPMGVLSSRKLWISLLWFSVWVGQGDGVVGLHRIGMQNITLILATLAVVHADINPHSW